MVVTGAAAAGMTEVRLVVVTTVGGARWCVCVRGMTGFGVGVCEQAGTAGRVGAVATVEAATVRLPHAVR